MKILPLSDLHLEFYEGEIEYTPSNINEDTVVVLAGDIHVGVKAIDWISGWCDRVKAVIYVPGNHEYYGNRIPTLDSKIRQEIEGRAMGNVYFLNNQCLELEGVKFIGSTLWSCFDRYDSHVMYDAQLYMNDYRKIVYENRGTYRRLRPSDTIAHHRMSGKFLKEELQKEFDGDTIVVTHHLPSWKFINEEYAGNGLNGAYAAHCDDILNVHHEKIAMWIFGHSHNAGVWRGVDDWDSTLFIQNSRGYPGYDEIDGFNESVWEILQ